VARRLASGAEERFPCERLALGAGTLSSARIFLATLRAAGGEEPPALEGLMDNRQVLVPFVNLALLARPADTRTYQYHNLALGLEAERPKEYVHGLITTLKSALIHPIVQSVPLDLRGALELFRNLHAALGILNVNYHDDRRAGNTVALAPDGRLVVDYTPAADEPARMKRTLARLKRVLWKLGCVVPPGMAHVRPMGASVHYSGTLPMTADARPLTCDPDGKSRDLEGLWLIDGSTLPFLPAKNLTFTLMACANRVAERMG
jgi:choline dehydrogenase-like flavoprotein